jgi:hypothetical protein
MGNKDFSEEAVQRAMSLYNSSLSNAREEAKRGKFLTLQEQFREMEKRAKGLHYSEQLDSLGERIEELEKRIKERTGG